MAIKKIEVIFMKTFKRDLEKIVKEHGEAVIVFKDDSGLRRRKIKDNGNCFVSYKGTHYNKWSRFCESCFMDYCSSYYHNYHNKRFKKKSPKNTIEAMVLHDDVDIEPLEITFGKGNKKKSIVVIRTVK